MGWLSELLGGQSDHDKFEEQVGLHRRVIQRREEYKSKHPDISESELFNKALEIEDEEEAALKHKR